MIVLDTHAVIWWATDDAGLSTKARQAIQKSVKAGGELLVSSISAGEVAMLIKAGRLALSMDVHTWLDRVKSVPGIRFVPVDNGIAVHSVTLPGEFHKDPADRIIVATAREYGVSLITADLKIQAYPHVRTVW